MFARILFLLLKPIYSPLSEPFSYRGPIHFFILFLKHINDGQNNELTFLCLHTITTIFRPQIYWYSILDNITELL